MLYLIKKHFPLVLENSQKLSLSEFQVWTNGLAKLMAHTKSFQIRGFLERKNQQPCLCLTLQIVVTLI